VTKLLKTRVSGGKPTTHDIVLIGCFEREAPELGGVPGPIAAAARKAALRTGWKGTRDQDSTVHIGGQRPTSVTLRGLGRRSKFDRRALKTWLANSLGAIAADGLRRPLLRLPGHEILSGVGGALCVFRDAALFGYSFGEYRKPSKEPRLRDVTIVPPDGEASAYEEGRRLALKVAAAIGTTRDLANTPPNVATPEWMAEQARTLAASHGMKIKVLEPDELEARGMGGLLAVGGGSAHPPRLVRLEWGSGERSISLVGKGVTFDTGGISLKPGANMDEMKFDKAGACTVMGIAQGAAELDLPYRFRAYLPLAENMPDGKAYRPSDIVRCYNGKTVEILNTDAEGRMILADALAWAAEEKPDSLLDFATLTGACVVALGHYGAGLFTHQDELAAELLAAAAEVDEYLWRLPLWPEFGEEVRGLHGDLQNLGVRWGGANSAAAFLSNFVRGARRWAHLDIAGPAYVARSNKQGFGSTGYGVGLTLAWLMREAQRA
jgi:leucyl aminopeptidase